MAKDPAFASPGPTARWERANRARLPVSWTRTPGGTLRLPFKFKLVRARCAGGSSPGCPGLGPGGSPALAGCAGMPGGNLTR